MNEAVYYENESYHIDFPNALLGLGDLRPQGKAIFYRTQVDKRSDQGVTITLNKSWEGVEAHLWTGFSRPGERASASVDLGSFML